MGRDLSGNPICFSAKIHAEYGIRVNTTNISLSLISLYGLRDVIASVLHTTAELYDRHLKEEVMKADEADGKIDEGLSIKR